MSLAGDPPDTSARRPADTGPGTLGKAFDVLEMVLSAAPPPSAAQITESLNLPRPTTNRILGNLVKLGLLKRDARQRQLHEGDRLLELALDVVARAVQRGPRHEILRELAEKISETCNVAMIVGGRVRYIDRVEAQWPLSLRLETGSELPLHCTAVGKLLLGHLPRAQRDKYLRTMALTRYTANTITDRARLERELDEIAVQGMSRDNEEYLPGVVGLAVPIPGGDEFPVLALGVAAPSARVTVADMQRDLPYLREMAAKLALCY